MDDPISVARSPLSDPDAQRLIGALNAELSAAYDPSANHFSLTEAEVAPGRGTFLLARLDGVAVGCAALRVLREAAGRPGPGIRRLR